MTERQYRQVLQNRSRKGVRRLFGCPASGSLLRQGARDLRRRQAAGDALERVLPRDWLGVTRVEQVCDGELRLVVSDTATAERIRRQATRLAKAIGQHVRGVTRLSVRRAW